jgi:serine/threonine-protein kinase HipA
MCRRCLYCYEPLADGESIYHAKCSRKLFGTSKVPILPYRYDAINDLAMKVIRAQTTLTGVQPKLSVDFDKGRNLPKRFTIVGLWGRYILKPQTESYRCLPELEDLTMHLAEIVKIKTVPHGLIPFDDGELCYITRRIDRTFNGDKLPMEDMCQLAERLTEDKYKSSYEKIAKLISKYSSVPKLDLVNYWEQVLFSWIVGNADMHLKNYSLYSKDDCHYTLAPAYDLLSTALVMPEDKEELALTLCGKKRKISKSNFLEAMKQSGLNDKVCHNIFISFGKVKRKWVELIHKSFLPEDMQNEYMELIESRISVLED